MQYGIFNDESADYTEMEALEADLYTREDAEKALADRYAEDEYAHVHEVEEPEDEEDDEEEDDEA